MSENRGTTGNRGDKWDFTDANDSPWSPRDEFLLRCLNIVGGMFYVMTYDEFADMYNQRAKHNPPPVSDRIDADEIDSFFESVNNCIEGDGSPLDKLLDEYGMYAARWHDINDRVNLIVSAKLIDTPPPKGVKFSSIEHIAHFQILVDRIREIHKSDVIVKMSNEQFFALEDCIEEADHELDSPCDEEDECDCSESDESEEEYEPIRVEELPPAKYTGPIDFKCVKNAAWRDRILWNYDAVRVVTRDFVKYVVSREIRDGERGDAARRLGFPVKSDSDFVLGCNLDIIAGDFASMMDDQHGEPAIKRVLKRKDELSELDRAAAQYYENYRYTWLEILAVKSGLGMKCRDLLTGEELFLMETSVSRSNVKGMTICAGIAPMSEVYLILGAMLPSNFDKPDVILKLVLSHLGIDATLPIRLSFSDQARFAAETIRRLRANGRIEQNFYGDWE